MLASMRWFSTSAAGTSYAMEKKKEILNLINVIIYIFFIYLNILVFFNLKFVIVNLVLVNC